MNHTQNTATILSKNGEREEAIELVRLLQSCKPRKNKYGKLK